MTVNDYVQAEMGGLILKLLTAYAEKDRLQEQVSALRNELAAIKAASQPKPAETVSVE